MHTPPCVDVDRTGKKTTLNSFKKRAPRREHFQRRSEDFSIPWVFRSALAREHGYIVRVYETKECNIVRHIERNRPGRFSGESIEEKNASSRNLDGGKKKEIFPIPEKQLSLERFTLFSRGTVPS